MRSPVKATRTNRALFRFYAELNDFLCEARQGLVSYAFDGHPAIKDAIEAQGIPHTEVDLLLVNGASVGFDYQLRDDDRISVYPVFESFDIQSLVRLRQAPLRELRFALDVNLGKLARWLRLLGFDVLYRNDYDDAELARVAAQQNRVVLTRDRRLLHRKEVSHGYWVRSVDPDEQVEEVLHRFQLERRVRPFHRCLSCNGRIHPVAKAQVLDKLAPKTRRYYDEFYQCGSCLKVYWKGPHYTQLQEKLVRFSADRPPACS